MTKFERLYERALAATAKRAIYAGWSCPTGPAELVDYLVEHGKQVSYRTFAKHVNVWSLPLEPTQFEVLATDWSVSWLKTRLPSGLPAWVAQHSRIEHLCLITPGDFDLDKEAELAVKFYEEKS